MPPFSDCDSSTFDEVFPDDPNIPSVAYQARENVPIFVPWSHHEIQLGAGFDSSVLSGSQPGQDVFRPAALASTSGNVLYEMDRSVNRNSFRQSSSSHAASSYEHMDFKGSLTAGGSVLGVSAQAQFSKSLYDNKDKSKVSLQVSLRTGRIMTASSPRLSQQAMSLLGVSPDKFRRTYGDYYLDALCIGADTTTFLSTSSSVDLKSEMRDIQVKAKFLGMSKTVYQNHKVTQHAGSSCDVTFNGLDTLSNFQRSWSAWDADSYRAITAEATNTVAGGMTLDRRVKEAMEGLGLGDLARGTIMLTQEQCNALCRSGLVVELMFMPYRTLRDYVAAA